MAASLIFRYQALVASGDLKRDDAQEAVARRLTLLEEQIAQRRLSRKSSSLGWLFGSGASAETDVKGLYIFGDVGRGKTLLMDLFFAASPVRRKRRIHFHEFMDEVHQRIHELRLLLKRGEIADDDPITLAAAQISDAVRLLCFDEFHVTDIADAMILGRLFARLFAAGVTIVATSNVEPGDLYKDGLNRTLFLPFIALIAQHMDVVSLRANMDYRLEKLAGAPVWYVPINEDSEVALDMAWQRLTGAFAGEPCNIVVKSRVLRIPQASRGVARFTFLDLCGAPLGAGDYLRIARDFHTVLIDRVPVMGYAERNEAKRFIALIDTFYDNAVKIVASAASEPSALYTAAEGYETQEFKRTVSRLIEMGSQAYLALAHGRRDARTDRSTHGIVET
ncbi:MAG: cell division protein ZapE [Proteobacteria bacterium]|nr:cell division protein ZapE [Pseudomonadota bacterium]